jgi:hypothetical protein
VKEKQSGKELFLNTIHAISIVNKFKYKLEPEYLHNVENLSYDDEDDH